MVSTSYIRYRDLCEAVGKPMNFTENSWESTEPAERVMLIELVREDLREKLRQRRWSQERDRPATEPDIIW